MSLLYQIIINKWHEKDISIKVRAARLSNAWKDDFIGSAIRIYPLAGNRDIADTGLFRMIEMPVGRPAEHGVQRESVYMFLFSRQE